MIKPAELLLENRASLHILDLFLFWIAHGVKSAQGSFDKVYIASALGANSHYQTGLKSNRLCQEIKLQKRNYRILLSIWVFFDKLSKLLTLCLVQLVYLNWWSDAKRDKILWDDFLIYNKQGWEWKWRSHYFQTKLMYRYDALIIEAFHKNILGRY